MTALRRSAMIQRKVVAALTQIRMLHDFPNGVPDLRPEEARDAKITADLVARRVLDWLERFPPT